MADNSSILSDFGINILEEEIDDFYRLKRTFLVDCTDVYGISRPLLHRRGSEHGLQDDGEA